MFRTPPELSNNNSGPQPNPNLLEASGWTKSQAGGMAGTSGASKGLPPAYPNFERHHMRTRSQAGENSISHSLINLHSNPVSRNNLDGIPTNTNPERSTSSYCHSTSSFALQDKHNLTKRTYSFANLAVGSSHVEEVPKNTSRALSNAELGQLTVIDQTSGDTTLENIPFGAQGKFLRGAFGDMASTSS